jgi:hypothetical protein
MQELGLGVRLRLDLVTALLPGLELNLSTPGHGLLQFFTFNKDQNYKNAFLIDIVSRAALIIQSFQ